MRWLPFMLLLLLGCVSYAHPRLLQYEVGGTGKRIVALTLSTLWQQLPSEAQQAEALALARAKCGSEVMLGMEAPEPDGLSYSWAFICKDIN